MTIVLPQSPYPNTATSPILKLANIAMVITFFCLPLSTALMSIAYLATVSLTLLFGKQAIEYSLHHPVSWAIGSLAAVYLLASFYSIAPRYEILEALRKHIWLFVTPLLFNLLHQTKWRHYALNAFLIAIGISLFFSYLKFYGKLNIGPQFTRASAFKNHITQNFFFAFTFAVSSYRFCYYQKWRWLYLSLAVLLAYNILFMSAGRTGYVIFPLMLAFIAIHRFGYKGLLLACLSTTVIFTLSYHYSAVFKLRVDQAITHTLQYQQGLHSINEMSLRYNQYQYAWQLIKQQPWLGYGTAGIKSALARLPQNQLLSKDLDATENSYLNILLQFGVVGLLIFLLMLASLALFSQQINEDELRFILHAYLAGFLLGALATDWITATTEAHLLSVLSAMSLGAALSQRSILKYQNR